MEHQKSQACEAGNTEKTKARRGNDLRNRKKTSAAEARGGRARKVERQAGLILQNLRGHGKGFRFLFPI